MSGFYGGMAPKLILSGALALGVLAGAAPARADVQHVVAKGHTLAAIAHRYHVSSKAIIEANGLKNPKRLRVGEVLTIPTAGGTSGAKGSKVAPKDVSKNSKPTKGERADKPGKPSKPVTYKARPKTPWVIHFRRAGTSETADVRVRDAKGKVSGAALRSVEKTLRSGGGATHPIEARLLTLLGIVSNHFGSRPIEVISGFRPFTTTQYNPHSNHNHGRAIDFRVSGVPNEVVRDFCRTLKNTGCGYYPNSTFVHMDTRDKSAFWVDYSRPGEAPRYNAPGLEADEGTSDVHNDSAGASDVTNDTPAETKPEAATDGKPEAATKPAAAKPEAAEPPANKPAADGDAAR
jgi:uncharacterized protein YcbK (DUF882 family)